MPSLKLPSALRSAGYQPGLVRLCVPVRNSAALVGWLLWLHLALAWLGGMAWIAAIGLHWLAGLAMGWLFAVTVLRLQSLWKSYEHEAGDPVALALFGLGYVVMFGLTWLWCVVLIFKHVLLTQSLLQGRDGSASVLANCWRLPVQFFKTCFSGDSGAVAMLSLAIAVLFLLVASLPFVLASAHVRPTYQPLVSTYACFCKHATTKRAKRGS